MNIHDAVDYLILKFSSHNIGLNLLKLESLLYYCHAFYYLDHDEPLFNVIFVRGVHGPKIQEMRERFLDSSFTIYESITQEHLKNHSSTEINEEVKFWLDFVFETFSSWSSNQICNNVINEDPYKWAENNGRINQEIMKIYYRGISKIRTQYPKNI